MSETLSEKEAQLSARQLDLEVKVPSHAHARMRAHTDMHCCLLHARSMFCVLRLLVF